MDAALASLLGAVIGGGIASGSNLGVEWYRDRRQARVSEENTKINLRRSSRLLMEEMRYGRSLILKAEQRGYFTWEPPRRELPNAAWGEHRASLAEHGSSDDWTAVARVYEEFDRLNWLVRDVVVEEGWAAEQMRPQWEGPSLSPSADLERVRELIDDGVDRLQRLEEFRAANRDST